MDDRPSLSARDYVESLHQNSRATLLYGKNNVLVQPVSTCWGIWPLKCSAPHLSQVDLMEKSTGSFLTWEGSDWTGFVEVLPSGMEELCFCLSTNRLLSCPLMTRGHKMPPPLPACLLQSIEVQMAYVELLCLSWAAAPTLLRRCPGGSARGSAEPLWVSYLET